MLLIGYSRSGLRESAAKNRGLGGDPRLKSGGHLLELILLLHADAAPRWTPNYSHKKIYVHKRDLKFSFNRTCVVYHWLCICTPEISASCIEPPREPCSAGGAPRVLTAKPKGIARNVLRLENAVLGTVPHDLQPP